MIDFTRYDSTGRILCFGTMQRIVFDDLTDVLEGQYNDELYYVMGGIPVPRPTFTPQKTELLADGVDETVVTGLPIPFIVDIDGEEYTVDDGSFEFSTTFPGTYKITPRTFPYRQQTIEVVAI